MRAVVRVVHQAVVAGRKRVVERDALPFRFVRQGEVQIGQVRQQVAQLVSHDAAVRRRTDVHLGDHRNRDAIDDERHGVRIFACHDAPIRSERSVLRNDYQDAELIFGTEMAVVRIGIEGAESRTADPPARIASVHFCT